MTNNGKIIGFDTKNVVPFIVTDNNIDKHSIALSESNYVDIILNGYKDSEFSWFSEKELQLVNDNNS